MKEIFEQVIHLGNYDLKTLLDRIDQYHIEGRLTDEERLDLIMQARRARCPNTTMLGRLMPCGRRFAHCSRMSHRPLKRTNGPNSCSPSVQGQPIRWATRLPSGVNGISVFWPTAYGARQIILPDGRNRHKRSLKWRLFFYAIKQTEDY